jgi:hypothetical protein
LSLSSLKLAEGTSEKMRFRFGISCLFGACLLLISSHSAVIGTNLPSPPAGEPTTVTAARVSEFIAPNSPQEFASKVADASSLSGPLPGEYDIADDQKDSGALTSLERAKAALAETNATPLSDHEICTTLVEVAQANELPVGFFAKLIWRESQFDHTAISPVGAMGIAQFMPAVAEKLGLDAFDARDALPASGRLLRTLRAKFGNLGLMAAAYNAGPKRVSDWLQQRAGLPKETRDYVSIITGKPVEHWRSAKPDTIAFKLPRNIPCHRTTEFVTVEQAEHAEQLRQIAAEEKLRKQIAAEQRLRKQIAEQKAREQIAAEKKSRRAIRQAAVPAKPKVRGAVVASRGQQS